MSFSVACPCGLEYSGRRPFAQPGRVADRSFHRLLWEIGRWLRTARRSLDELDCERWTLERYLDERRYSAAFRRHFLVPLTAALWSTAPGRALEYPAAAAIRFFDNHGMLGLRRFRWRTVTGGADTYVAELARRLGPRLRVGLGVRSVRRDPDGVEIRTGDDAAPALRRGRRGDARGSGAPAPRGSRRRTSARLLGAFAYTRNDATLHTDASHLPATTAARASWNYRLGDDGRPTITYYLNRLQRLETDEDWCVTLNGDVAEEHVVDRTVVRASALHRRRARRAARASAPRAAPAARGTPARTTATASTRTASPPVCAPPSRSEPPGEVGAVRGDARARAALAGTARLPLPGRVLAARPRRARRARPALPAALGEPPGPRLLPRRRPLRRRRHAAEGGGDPLRRRPVDRARARADAAPRARLRLQPGLLLLVLPGGRVARVHGRRAEQHVRRAPAGAAARRRAHVRARQAAARLAVHGPRPALPLHVLRAGRDRARADRGARDGRACRSRRCCSGGGAS